LKIYFGNGIHQNKISVVPFSKSIKIASRIESLHIENSIYNSPIRSIRAFLRVFIRKQSTLRLLSLKDVRVSKNIQNKVCGSLKVEKLVIDNKYRLYRDIPIRFDRLSYLKCLKTLKISQGFSEEFIEYAKTENSRNFDCLQYFCFSTDKITCEHLQVIY